MRTSVDTNVLSALWSNEPGAGDIAMRLGQAKQAGAVLVCGVVYAELLAYPAVTENFLNEFFEQTGITVDFRFEDEVWREAGRRFARYANRRRQGTGESPRRLLFDFLVGAHAMVQADRLFTLDTKRYQHDFPELLL